MVVVVVVRVRGNFMSAFRRGLLTNGAPDGRKVFTRDYRIQPRQRTLDCCARLGCMVGVIGVVVRGTNSSSVAVTVLLKF